MTRYDKMQTTAFQIGDTTAWNRTFHLLRFPERWKESLLELTGNDYEYGGIPIRRLNKALSTLVPDIVTVATKATRGVATPWVYADVATPVEYIFPVITAWVRTLARTGREQQLERALTTMDAADLVWEPIEVEFADAVGRVARNECDDLLADKVYRLLPHQAATVLSREGVQCEHKGEDDDTAHSISVFRRCPTYGGPAEIMSWPPHHNPAKPFSFTVSLAAQTRPFDGTALLYTHVGARRWAYLTPNLETKVGSTVFFLPSVPWLAGTELTRSFLRAAVKLNVTRDAHGDKVYKGEWDDLTVKVLTQLGVVAPLSLAEEIRKNPKTFLDHATTPAGLVYRNGLYTLPNKPPKRHKVLPGVSVKDRVRILDWIDEATGGALKILPPAERSRTIAIPGLRMLNGTDTETLEHTVALRKSIAWATQTRRLVVELRYDTTAILDAALSTLQSQLGVKFPLPEPPTISFEAHAATDELNVTVRVEPIGALAADLETNERYRNALERIQRAVQKRADDIESELTGPDPDSTTVTLVEIGGKENYKGKRREKDPKFAIRHGFNLKGRLTQFVTPSDEDGHNGSASVVEPAQDEPTDATAPAEKKDPNTERLRNCWRDLWRQLGARAEAIPTLADGLPAGPRYLAFYVIRQNRTRVWGATRQVPIAVIMNADGGSIRVKGPGMDFTPLHTGVLELGRAHVMANKKRSPEEVAAFFKDVLTDLEPRDGLFLLTEAQNARAAWTFLQNTGIVIDSLKFGEKGDLLSVYDFPGLRHVRVRTDQRNETPEGFAVSDDGEGHSAGLWTFGGERVFLSTAEKPFTAHKAVKDNSKVEPRIKIDKDGTRQEVPPQPGALVWNHQLVELAVVAKQEGDEPKVWAALAHDLRKAAPHTDKRTVRPWPLHLAKLIGEYVLPVELLSEVEAEDNDEPPLLTGAKSLEQLEWEQPELDFGE